MSEHAGFIKDVKTGAILGLSRKSSIEQIAMNNQDLIKRGQKHLIEYEVLGEEEGQKAFNKYVSEKLGKMLVGIPSEPIEVKKSKNK
jgi:hypothetical protein